MRIHGCGSPLLANAKDENTGVRLGVASSVSFVHPCGPLSGVPTRWMRFTGSKANTSVSVKPVNGTDKLVLSVFSSAACNESVLVGCSDDAREPNVDLTDAAGKTYFVAVGVVSTTGSGAAMLRIDR